MHVDFKIATLIYCSLSGMASAYLVTDCQLLYDEGRRHLRSANLLTCTFRRTYSNSGDICFVPAGTRLGTAFQWSEANGHWL